MPVRVRGPLSLGRTILLLGCCLGSAAGFASVPAVIGSKLRAPRLHRRGTWPTAARFSSLGCTASLASTGPGEGEAPRRGHEAQGGGGAVLPRATFVRSLLVLLGGGLFAEAASAKGEIKEKDIAARLEGPQLPQLPADLSNNDDVPYPDWLEGQWKVEALMTSWKAPMGNKFLGGITPEVNEASAAEAAAQVGSVVKYDIRFVRDSSGKVREDRPFNTQQRLDAYSGRSVVRRVEYVPLDRGGKTTNLNTLTYFRGGLVGKVFSTRRRWANSEGGTVFLCDEGKRELYGRRCDIRVERTCPPPITTDQEVVSRFRAMDDGGIEGAVRIAGFLNPNDKLFFEASQRAVTISDFALKMVKTEVTPQQQQPAQGGGGVQQQQRAQDGGGVLQR